MFDVLSLKTNNTLEKVCKVTCAEAPKGQEPTLTILVSDTDIPTHEEAIQQAYRLIHTGESEGYQKRDHILYCQKMVAVVQGSDRLFLDGGKSVHSEEYLLEAIKKSQVFRQWLANEIITAIAELRDLSKVQIPKN